MTKNQKSKLTDGHYISLSDAAGSGSTITVYGKVIKDAALDPTATGILHPKTRGDNLILGQVVGFVEGGQCRRINPAVVLTLPEPDGPADGCGWDPSMYVVWKNLPKSWVTLHLRTEPRALADILATPSPSGSRPALGAPMLGVRDTVVQIVRTWAGMPKNPQGSDLLQALWDTYSSGPFPDAAQDLVTHINNAFGTHLLAADINPPGSIKTVDDLVSAIT
jgi:hypothetical protein